MRISPLMGVLCVLIIIMVVNVFNTLFGGLSKILEAIGLGNTKGDDQVYDLFEDGTPVGSAWNGLTWQKIPTSDIPSYWKDAYVGYNVFGVNSAGVRKVPKPVNEMLGLAREIDGTVSVWGDSVDGMLGTYKAYIRSRAEFSFYVWCVNNYNKVDVLEWLQGKDNLSGYDAFSNEEIAKLDNWLKNLPKV